MVGRNTTQGSVLISVLVALIVIAAVSQILHLQRDGRTDQARTEVNRKAAQYLSEAGLRHALWHARTSASGSYSPLINGQLTGIGSYKVHITPHTGSPITVRSMGTTASGTQFMSVRSYPVQCAGKTMQTRVITGFVSGMEPDTLYQKGQTGPEPGYFDPRANTNEEVRVLMAFDIAGIPQNVPLESAELMLHVGQHDSSMEGGQLLIDRVTSPWQSGKTNWSVRISPKTTWSTPGGDYTTVDEASVNISAGTTVYTWNVKALTEGWVKNQFKNYGVLLRANVPGSDIGDGLRLKRNTGSTPAAEVPRLVVKYCE